jgi:hypothetical protein
MLWRYPNLIIALSLVSLTTSGVALGADMVPCSIKDGQTFVANMSSLKTATTTNHKYVSDVLKKLILMNTGTLCFALGQQDQILLTEVGLNTYQFSELDAVQKRVIEMRDKYHSILSHYCSRTTEDSLARIPTTIDLKAKLPELVQEIDAALDQYSKIKCDPTR